MGESGGERSKSVTRRRALRPPPYVESDVLVAGEVRLGLKLSWSHWYRVAPSLPVTYMFGKQSPRYIWGEVLKAMKRMGAAA